MRHLLWFRAIVAVALASSCAGPAWSQRIQFPSQYPGSYAQPGAQPPAGAYNGWVPYGGGATVGSGPQYYAAPPVSSWDPYAPGNLQPPTITSPFGATAPPVLPPASAPPYGYGSPYVGQPGGVPPGYSGYGAPGPVPYGATPLGGAPNAIFPNSTYRPFRFLNELRLDTTHMLRSSRMEFQTTDVEVNGSFAFPFFGNAAPLLITPGFAFRFWDGPDTSSVPGNPDLPARVYDAYLEGSWKPVVAPWLSGDLAVRAGVFSDFRTYTNDSLRIRGRGVGIITLSPMWQVAVGATYINRNDLKLLPVAGLIWTPNPNAKIEAVFPYPKATFRFTRIGNTDLFWYVRGEYGGGAWSIQRDDGTDDEVDYNDYRVALGLEFASLARWKGALEVGYVWNREFLFESATPDFHPDETVMFRGLLTY